MLSVIICSQRPVLDERLVENIGKTVGMDYEIVHIDNSQRCYNIFEAYNLGVERAKGKFLCFMHEDVVIHTMGWGPVVESYLQQDFVGALGVAGGCVILDQLDWRFYGFGYMYLIQGTSTVEESPRYYHSFVPQRDSFSPIRQVAAIDGVWMCFRKAMFEEISFDAETFHDFHLYDTDICMQVNKVGKGVFLTTDVLLEHQSMGTFTVGYQEALTSFARKWKADLPMVKGSVVTRQQMDVALAAAQPRFDERLRRDAIVVGLRNLFALKRNGETIRQYSDEEIMLMDESLYNCCRLCFKDATISKIQAKDLLKHYLSVPYAHKKFSILLKYMWYRLLNYSNR